MHVTCNEQVFDKDACMCVNMCTVGVIVCTSM